VPKEIKTEQDPMENPGKPANPTTIPSTQQIQIPKREKKKALQRETTHLLIMLASAGGEIPLSAHLP